MSWYNIKPNPFPIKIWQLLLVFLLADCILFLFIPFNVEKLGEYGKQHIIIRKTTPIWPFSNIEIIDTVFKDRIITVQVVDLCGSNGIHVLKDGKEKHVHVTKSSLFRANEKVKVFESNYPEEVTEIVEDRIPTDIALVDNNTGKIHRAFKIERRH